MKKSAERLLAARAEGGGTQTLPQQLRSLFSTMEMNLVSDSVPFVEREQSGAAVEIPTGFFVDGRLAAPERPVSASLAVYKAALAKVDSRSQPDVADARNASRLVVRRDRSSTTA